MVCLNKKTVLPLFAVLTVLASVSLSAKDPDFKLVELDNVSRYTEDRVAYQQVQKFIDPSKDDSFAALLIIRKGKMYLLKDGYDDPRVVADNRKALILDNIDFKEDDLWKNKMNGKPDYIRVTDRREELTKNLDEDYVSKNFGAIYIKTRDQLLTEQVEIFKSLMRNRRESGLTVVHEPLLSGTVDASSNKGISYYTSATAKSNEGWVYFAEDNDGDGITETFSVYSPDNFHWGYKSGANRVFIYKNKDKDVEKLIGDLTKNAFYGTPEEAKTIVDTFPKDVDIEEIIKQK
jgi:hypothetical protein